GKAYTELGVVDSAIQYLKRSLEAKAFVNESRLLLARVNYKKKSFAECIEMYKNVPADTLTAEDYFKYGFAIENVHGFDAAVKFYEIANEKFGYSTVAEALITKEKVAKVKLKAKSYRDALELMKTVTAVDKEGKIATESYFLMAEAYEGVNDISNAISSLEKAIAINSRNIEAYARLADLYQKSGNSEKAKKVFEVMMGLSPNDPSIYLSLGNYNLKSGKYSEALQNFEKSCELKKTPQCKLGIAKANFELKKYELSMGSAEEALKLDPKSIEAQKVLALAYFKQGEYGKAAPLFEKVVQAQGDNIELLTALAECYEKTKDTEKLAVVDKKIVKMDEKDLKSRIRLASYYELKNNLLEAISLYKEAIALEPSSVDILKKLYQLSKKNGDRGTAVAYLVRYISIKSNDAEAHRDLGDLYYEQKDYDKALEEYRTALKLDPSIKGFYSRYAEIVMAKGEQNEVIKALRGVIASGNADAGTYMTLGMMYQKKGEYIDAMEMYQKVLDIEPSNFDALVGLGACQAAQGEIKNAIISYEQAIMMKPDAVKELRELGDLYLRAFRKEEAYKAYRKYLAADSSDTELAKSVG
ncbi:MAG: tetratricopeptide repeat protein, partial [Chitinispirillaceae bacterium]|nr:tetratricopeptide repeat protein [Chitinispirillaceae bacterium]